MDIWLAAVLVIFIHSTQLTFPAGYEKYIWSTGAATNSITLEGSLFTPGIYPIWCTVTNNICVKTDTVMIEVINDYGISEIPEIEISIRPNPFNAEFIISCEQLIENVQIFEYSGKRLADFHLAQDLIQPVPLKLPQSKDRMLILKLETCNGIYYRKLVQKKSGN